MLVIDQTKVNKQALQRKRMKYSSIISILNAIDQLQNEWLMMFSASTVPWNSKLGNNDIKNQTFAKILTI